MPKQVKTEWLARRLLERPHTPAYDNDGLRIQISTIRAGNPHCVVSMRNSLFSGQQPTNVAFDIDIDIRSLRYEGGVWMTDSPQEIWQMYQALEKLAKMHEPRLLIGGLGLGVFSHLSTEYAGAIATTVERDERIINAVAPWSARNVVKADIYEFADEVEVGEYDAAFLDTWQSTGEYCWTTEVVPLRRKLAKKIKKVWCWQEEEMIGQVAMTGLQVMCMPLDRLPSTSVHQLVLRQKAEQAGIVDDSEDFYKNVARLAENQIARGILDRFLKNVGSRAWEAEFGQAWDQFVAGKMTCKS